MSGKPYLSSDDSALLRRALRRYSGENCLEIGAGNGGNLVELSKKFTTVVGTDVVRPGMSDWKAVGNMILTDGASALLGATFDLVTFNPPYVADDAMGDRAVEGGRAMEVPRWFLREALRTVKRKGAVLFLLSDGAEVEGFEHICEQQGFGLRMVESLRVFFEELSVYEATSKV